MFEPASQENEIPINVYEGKMLLCNERNFWQRFYKDLNSAHKIVHIVSPFITVRRSGYLSNCFREMISRGVKIIIHTRYVNEHENLQTKISAKFSILALRRMGVQFYFISKIHRKVAVIDNRICWAGSLNILSWNNTPEQMNRFDSANIASEFIRELNLRT